MKIKIAQMIVDHDLAKNKKAILSVLDDAQQNEWIVFPECALTGYFPEEDDFLQTTNTDLVKEALNDIASKVKDKGCYCVLGSATNRNDKWYNSAVIFSSSSDVVTYDKIALSDLDKRHFQAGQATEVYEIDGIKFGVQICRELMFPVSWTELKQKGAQIVFHINNAIKPYDNVWKHLIISRAVENSYFVCSANNAAAPQELTSYLVDPNGNVLIEAERQTEHVLDTEIDIADFSSVY